VFGLFGPGLDNLLQSYGVPAVPWWAYAAIGFVVVSVLAYFNIELSGRVLAVLLIGEVLIVLALDAAVVFSGGGPEGFSSGLLSPAEIVSGAPGFAILFAILSFIGFEATAVFRDEAKNPDRTIPRATYIALIAIGVFYAFSSWALISGNGESTVIEKATNDPGGILATTTEQYLGTVGGHIIQVLFVTSLFACILSFHNIATRYFYSLARRGVLAKPLGIAHEKHGSPSRASIVTAAIVGALVVVAAALQLDPINQFYTWLGGISSVGFVLLLLLTTAAVIGIFRREQHDVSLWRRLIAPLLAFAGLLAFFAVILINLPVLVGEASYGPFSYGVLVLLAVAFAAGPIIGRFRRPVEVD
jgi:amino acid transporter